MFFGLFSYPKQETKRYVNSVTIRDTTGRVVHQWGTTLGDAVSIEKQGARTIVRHEGIWSETVYEPSLSESVEYEVW
jgi:hypothetical protein